VFLQQTNKLVITFATCPLFGVIGNRQASELEAINKSVNQ